MGVEKGIGMGFFATPLANLIPGGHLDGQHHHLRQKLVDRAPQTVAVAPDLRLATVERRSERAWKGAVVGLGTLRVAGVSWLGRAYQKDRRPKPLISLEKTILTSSPKTARRLDDQDRPDSARRAQSAASQNAEHLKWVYDESNPCVRSQH